MKYIKILKNGVIATALLMMSAQSSSAQAVEQGNISIGAFYGSPSIGTLLVKSVYLQEDNIGDAEVNFSYLGPVGGKFEYMVTDEFGIGVEASYSIINLEVWDSFDRTELTLTKFRIMPRFAYHVAAGEMIDFFFSGGVGYRHSSYSFTSSDVIDDEVDNALTGLLPMTLRINTGVSFYVTKHLALTGELGFGGGYLLLGGITFKLPTVASDD